MTNNEHTQLEEIVEIEDNGLSLREIELIANSEVIRQRFEQKFEGQLYTIIMLSLTHETYDEREAARLWQAINRHREQLRQMLARDVGIVVAALDYMTNIESALSNPKIIEQSKSNFVSRVSTTDELTGLYLRDVFDMMVRKECDEARRKQLSLCLLMLDIDNFKTINDTYGHQMGDTVLHKVGDCINHSVREMDFAARYGGEELVVLMPATTDKEGLKIAERIRKRIEQLSFDGFTITISGGLANTNDGTEGETELIESADSRLYRAKALGKNRIVVD